MVIPTGSPPRFVSRRRRRPHERRTRIPPSTARSRANARQQQAEPRSDHRSAARSVHASSVVITSAARCPVRGRTCSRSCSVSHRGPCRRPSRLRRSCRRRTIQPSNLRLHLWPSAPPIIAGAPLAQRDCSALIGLPHSCCPATTAKWLSACADSHVPRTRAQPTSGAQRAPCRSSPLLGLLRAERRHRVPTRAFAHRVTHLLQRARR